MSNKKTNLAKNVHVYSGLEDMGKQFANDVATMGQEFTKLVDKHFDPTNPWDQSVLVAILTNLLAYVEVYAEMDDACMEEAMKGFYEEHLKVYRKQRVQREKDIIKSKKVKK